MSKSEKNQKTLFELIGYGSPQNPFPALNDVVTAVEVKLCAGVDDILDFEDRLRALCKRVHLSWQVMRFLIGDSPDASMRAVSYVARDAETCEALMDCVVDSQAIKAQSMMLTINIIGAEPENCVSVALLWFHGELEKNSIDWESRDAAEAREHWEDGCRIFSTRFLARAVDTFGIAVRGYYAPLDGFMRMGGETGLIPVTLLERPHAFTRLDFYFVGKTDITERIELSLAEARASSVDVARATVSMPAGSLESHNICLGLYSVVRKTEAGNRAINRLYVRAQSLATTFPTTILLHKTLDSGDDAIEVWSMKNPMLVDRSANFIKRGHRHLGADVLQHAARVFVDCGCDDHYKKYPSEEQRLVLLGQVLDFASRRKIDGSKARREHEA